MKTGYTIGGKVRLKAPVWNEDSDGVYAGKHIGKSGDILIVKRINPHHWKYPLHVSHEDAYIEDVSFGVRFEEVEPIET